MAQWTDADYAQVRSAFTTYEELHNHSCHESVDEFNYRPVCPFPYVPKGWLSEDDDDFDINDCTSTTWADTQDNYATKCMIYTFASIPPFLWCLQILYTRESFKKLFTPKLSESEKIVLLGLFWSFSCIVLASDIDCWGGHIPWQSLRTLLMGASVAAGNHQVIILVRLWVTLADGGKQMVCPQWMIWVTRTFYYGGYIIEILFSYLEVNAGKVPNTAGGSSGDMGNVKYLWTMLYCVVFGFLCIKYNFRIRSMLKRKDGNDDESTKKILSKTAKLTFLTALGCVLFFLGRFGALNGRWGKTYQKIPPCETITATIPDGLWISRTIISYVVPWFNQAPPGKKKEVMVLTYASTAVSEDVASRASTSSKVVPEE